MFDGLLSRTFYGNSMAQWFTAFGIAVASLVAGRALYWLLGNVVEKLTAKTKTRLDDLIVDMVEEPVVLIVTLWGAWLGIGMLTLPATLQLWMGNALRFVVILTAAWMVTRLLDALYKEYLVPLAGKTETQLDDQLLLRGLASQETRLEPTASVAFSAFGESAMNLNFVYFIRKNADILATQTAVNMAIVESFAGAGLEFAYPTRTLYTKQG